MKNTLIALLLLVCSVAMSQTTNPIINNYTPFRDGASFGKTTKPVASAVLEMSSTTKGALLPRMTSAQRIAIVSPATGLLVYQTDGDDGVYYWDGSVWSKISSGAEWTEVAGVIFPSTADTVGLQYVSAQDSLVIMANTKINGHLRVTGSSPYDFVTDTLYAAGIQVPFNGVGRTYATGVFVNGIGDWSSIGQETNAYYAGYFGSGGQSRLVIDSSKVELRNVVSGISSTNFSIYNRNGDDIGRNFVLENIRPNKGYVGFSVDTGNTFYLYANAFDNMGTLSSIRMDTARLHLLSDTVGVFTSNLTVQAKNTNALRFVDYGSGMSLLYVSTEDTSVSDFGTADLTVNPEDGFFATANSSDAATYSRVWNHKDYVQITHVKPSAEIYFRLDDTGVRIEDGDSDAVGAVLTIDGAGYAKWQPIPERNCGDTIYEAIDGPNKAITYGCFTVYEGTDMLAGYVDSVENYNSDVLTETRYVNAIGAFGTYGEVSFAASMDSVYFYSKLKIYNELQINPDAAIDGGVLTSDANGNATWQHFQPPQYSATDASALTPADGWMIYVTDTDATFTSVGFWGYVSGTWTALH